MASPYAPSIVSHLDTTVDALFDRLRGRPVVDRVFYTASEVADFSLVWHLLGITRALRRGGDLQEALRVSALLGLESAIVNGLVKSAVGRSRPAPDSARPHHLRQPRTSSFPSGHASAAAVFVAVAGQDDSLAPLYVLAAVTVAASRIHVRIHHASDVLGGAVVGAVLGVAFRRWWPTGPRRRGG